MNGDKFRRYFDASNRRDYEGIRRFYEPDLLYVMDGMRGYSSRDLQTSHLSRSHAGHSERIAAVRGVQPIRTTLSQKE